MCLKVLPLLQKAQITNKKSQSITASTFNLYNLWTVYEFAVYEEVATPEVRITCTLGLHYN